MNKNCHWLQSSELISAMGESSLKRRRCDSSETQLDAYFKSYSDVRIHQEMIGDRVRTSTYKLAILRNFEHLRGKVVVDVGAGTGILSMFCIQAGAKKVYAIEASDIAKQAELVVRSNQMEDRITVIHGKVEDVDLPEKVDAIVSEWMGYFLMYESMLQSVILARDKWLKKGGIILPNVAKLYLAPVAIPTLLDESLSFWDEMNDRYGVNLSVLKPYTSECMTRNVHVETVDAEEVMSRPVEICSLSLETIQAEHLNLMQNNFSFDCFGDAAVNGFVAWFKVFFQGETVLSTSPYDVPTHWQQCVFYLNKEIHVKQSDKISGSISVQPNAKEHRFLDIRLKYAHNGSEETVKSYQMDEILS